MSTWKKRKTDGTVSSSAQLSMIPQLSTIQEILRVSVWSEDRDEVFDALSSLAMACSTSDQNCKQNCTESVQSGAGGILAGVMRKWSGDAGVQAKACLAIGNICYDDNGSGFFLGHAVETGVLFEVVRALEQYPKIEAVQLSGLYALNYLCSNNKRNANHAVDELNILPLVLRASRSIKDHRKFGCIVDQVCCVLGSLSAFQDICQDIIDAGGIRSLDDARIFYRNDNRKGKDHYKQCASTALRNLSAQWNP